MEEVMLLGKYPIDSKTNVRAAADYFEMYGNKFSDLEKVAYAQGLVSRMLDFELEPTEKLARYATASVRNNFEVGIRLRDKATGGHYSDELAEITKLASQSDAFTRVSLLEDFDKEYNLTNCYNRLIPTPFDSFFMSEKTASDLSNESVWTGPTSDRLSKSAFLTWVEGSHNRGLLQEKFGYDLATALCGSGAWDVFSSLPDPHKQIIARLVNDNVINGTNSPGLSRYSVAGAERNEDQYETATSKLKKLLDR